MRIALLASERQAEKAAGWQALLRNPADVI